MLSPFFSFPFGNDDSQMNHAKIRHSFLPCKQSSWFFHVIHAVMTIHRIGFHMHISNNLLQQFCENVFFV